MERKRYLYASGKRVVLEPDREHVVVDLDRARVGGMTDGTAAALSEGTSMPGGLVLSPRSSLSPAALKALTVAGALRAAYRRGAVIAVPMPEVRIEVDDPEQHAAALAAIELSNIKVELVSSDEDLIVVRPRSGTGEDALDLAAFVHEHAHPAVAAPRMLQVTPRPGLR
ncbi:MAG: hypothetical protein WDO69_18825 [Pseudomonadota bacterium]